MQQYDLRALLSNAYVNSLKEEVVLARERSIEAYLQTDFSQKKFLNLVRFVFSLRTEYEFTTDFREAFQKFDSQFPAKGAMNELKILAHATLLKLFQINNNSTGFIFSLATNNCFGFGLRDRPNDIRKKDLDFIDSAEWALQHNISTLRMGADVFTFRNLANEKLGKFQSIVKKTEFSDSEKDVKDLFMKFITDMKLVGKEYSNILEQVSQIIEIHDNESRILWWAFTDQSTEFHKPWSELRWLESCMIVGKELSDLVTVIPGPVSYMNIISTLLNKTKEKIPASTTLSTLISMIPNTLKESLVSDLEVDELTPLHYAILKSLEISSAKKLTSTLEEARIQTTKRLTVTSVATQIYRERLYLKSFLIERESNG